MKISTSIHHANIEKLGGIDATFAALKEAGFEEGTAGENLGYGFWTPEEVCLAWKNSRTHYNNIIDPRFTQIGIGVAADPDERGKLCWANHFLT